jgi:hypothetical protein
MINKVKFKLENMQRGDVLGVNRILARLRSNMCNVYKLETGKVFGNV